MRILTIVIIFGGFLYIALFLLRSSINLEGAQTMWISSRPLSSIVTTSIVLSDGPLYYIVANLWGSLFGFSVSSLRVLSLIFYGLTLLTLYSLARMTSNKAVSFITVLLFALSPLVVLYSSAIGMHMMMVFVVTLTHRYFLEMVRTNAKLGKVGYILSLTAGLYTHYLFGLVALSQIVYLGFKAFADYRSGRMNTRKTGGELVQAQISGKRDAQGLWRYLFVYQTILVLLSPLLILAYRLGGFPFPLIADASYPEFMQILSSFFVGFPRSIPDAFLVSFWPLLGILVFFVFASGRRLEMSQIGYFLLVTVFPLAVAFGLSFMFPLFSLRYLIFIAPSFFILLAMSLFRGSVSLSFSLTPLVLLVMFVFLAIQVQVRADPVDAGYSGVASFVAERALISDVIAVSPPVAVFPVEFYYSGPSDVVTIPNWNYANPDSVPRYREIHLEEQLSILDNEYQYLYLITTDSPAYTATVRSVLERRYETIGSRHFSPDITLTVFRFQYDGSKTVEL